MSRTKILHTLIFLSFILLLQSCTEEKFLFAINRVKVKNYPVDTPFVYNNKINIDGKISKDEEARLQENLVSYWSDSLYARRVQKLGYRYILKKPPVFDTSFISTTRSFMNSFLFSQGYFNTAISDTFHIDTVRKGSKPPQYRTTVEMNIDVGKRVIIDSFGYDLQNTGLQRIAKITSKASKITPGKTPYSKEVLGAELDRLVDIYRSRGYYLLQRSNLVTVVDTGNIALLNLTVDPFEQMRLAEQAQQKKQENPAATVSIQQRRLADTANSTQDTSFLRRFYTGNIYYFPETYITELPDTILKHTALYKTHNFRNYSVYYMQGLFRPKIFRQFNFLHFERLYNDNLFYKTVNTLNQTGAWKQVDTRTVIRGDSLDIYYFLYPDRKQNISYNLEASRNTGDVLTSSNFFGLALNTTYRNRNVWHNAVQSSTSFVNGVELSLNQSQTNSLIQAFQISLGQTYSFPRAFIPFKIKRPGRFDFGRTVISANASYADRRDYFRLRSFVADYGYDWKKKNKVWQTRFPNIELYALDTLPLLVQAFEQNPFLRNSFNTGKVISARGSLVITYPGKTNITNYVRFSSELSVPWLYKISDRIYEFVKAEAEYRKTINMHKTVLATRAFAGIGYNYHVSQSLGITLPFYKQFIAGGPNSMRAWGLRQLGLGSSLLSDTSTTFTDRYGDMQLEANVEYRYPIAHYSSLNLGGAFFVDAGNIWNVRKDTDNPKSEFSINRLGKDVAIGVGTGLRFDFNYFLIRVDMGIKLKDPARLENNGWLDIAHFTWRNHEFDKYNDEGKLISAKRNNYAVQLGIGLPF
ncbi:BamA/TamA family outer membrane protein [Parafilimonas sp.]|uniref:BamA/TamA family outer membrane protein n=1 Tax=Parafilimonas sp. TaxID=1969739 RepID=UPI0039E30E67